jgi:hypothetical protein
MTPNPSTCERCGTFTEGRPLVGPLKVCDACAQRQAKAARYWPAGYLIGVGCLLNPALAALLLTLNYRRLGDAKQARGFAVVTAMLACFYLAVMIFDLPIPASVLLPASIVGGVQIGRAWQGPWASLRERGAQRANLWLPPLLTVLAILGVAMISGALSP